MRMNNLFPFYGLWNNLPMFHGNGYLRNFACP